MQQLLKKIINGHQVSKVGRLGGGLFAKKKKHHQG